ncbi:putative NADH dehydrogenase [ubiquinone] 1 alpha subcomplex subunit 12 [Halotydeus destructor]|nr:putative NADH dehydrogenase [ubiquinone] 1 alpha subcomplex subunit 12 [Halotydeus destructor]
MGSVGRFIGLDKAANLLKVLKHNKGVFGLLGKIFRMDSPFKYGELVGVDKYGNKYYKNDAYFVGRNRWVEYNDKSFLDYDASMVPAEWHNWLHYICDDTPTENPRVNHKWMIDFKENLSGSSMQYVPYSTTPRKIEPWVPKGTNLKIEAPK